MEDLPLINLADWADFMVYLYNESDNNGENVYSLTCEVNEEEKWVKLTRESGSDFPVSHFDTARSVIPCFSGTQPIVDLCLASAS